MANDDLISRQAAIDAACTCHGGVHCNHYPCKDLQAIMDLPSAERHGRWIRTGEDGYCSICNCDMPMYKEDWEWRYLETPYCPNCGARMEASE